MAELMDRLMKVCVLFGYSFSRMVTALATEDTSALTANEVNLYNNFIDRYRTHKARFNIYVS